MPKLRVEVGMLGHRVLDQDRHLEGDTVEVVREARAIAVRVPRAALGPGALQGPGLIEPPAAGHADLAPPRRRASERPGAATAHRTEGRAERLAIGRWSG